ncbi:hypothetical protein A1A1_09606 [Planococcus antarcticus DSM 14505]|uniref:Uncharacterized protein n=1 Tax=Planococcus antarcticus DSM 14505 TaxID=1185653 RepID=A0A1C7DHN7_9BACL|nr:hypothetical protein [Planococcus antarcticus]ANU10713.1 hypothetical protein BBH88_10510 [Planococcus antarcticus DSM 14505]EIM06801.1 hypothetical protein A1A1_09606 [Planococcus antarcticus DSM 14505]
MSNTPENIVIKLSDANQAGIDMSSPKAVVTFLLAQGEKESILFFYKPGSVEFDFDKFNTAVAEMKERKN